MQIIVVSMSLYDDKRIDRKCRKVVGSDRGRCQRIDTVIGVGVLVLAVAVTAWDLGDWIMIALKVLARIAYIIATIAIVNLIKEIFEQLLPVITLE
jgi:hypothetical protein